MTVAAWVLPSWGRSVVTAERLARARVRRRRLRLAIAALTPLLLAASAWAVRSAVLPSPIAARGGVSLWRTGDGLLIADPFGHSAPLRDLKDTFAFGGSATPGVGYAVASGRGLSVGVLRHPARFEGWFAVTRAGFPSSGVYHVLMAKPPGELRAARARGEAVFAVQTGTTKATGLINYVVVASSSHEGTTTWSVGYAAGHLANAHLHQFVRMPAPPASPTVRSVTLETDGRRRLAVWFGTRLVFASDHLSLDIAPPFQAYLEVQSRLVPYASSFRDFWVTSGSTISVLAHDGARLRLVAPNGKTLATATVRNGGARLVLPPPHAQGTAELYVRLRNRAVRLGPFQYAGGDQYRLSGLASATPRG